MPVLGSSVALPLQALTVSSVADNDGMEDCQAPVPLRLALAAGPAQRVAAPAAPLPCPAPVSSSTPELATNSCVGSSNQSPNQGGHCSRCPWEVRCAVWDCIGPVCCCLISSRQASEAQPMMYHLQLSGQTPMKSAVPTATCPLYHVQSRSICTLQTLWEHLLRSADSPLYASLNSSSLQPPLVCRAEAVPHL